MGTARGQDAEPVAKADYPASLVDRPLVLPASLFEARGTLRTMTYGDGIDVGFGELSYFDIGGAVGVGSTEVFAEVSTLLSQPDWYGGDQQDLDRITIGARSLMSPKSVIDLRAAYWQPMSDVVSGIDLRGAYSHRHQGSERLSLHFGGGARYLKNIFHEDSPFGSDPYMLFIEGRTMGQSQLSPKLALEFGLELSIPVADGYGDSYDPNSTTTIRAAGIVTGRTLDVSLGLELISGNGVTAHQFTFGAATRI